MTEVANVGVRVFPDLTATLARIDTRDSTTIGICLPAHNANTTYFPADVPVAFSSDNAEAITALGAGEALDTIAQINSEGIVANIVFVRANVASNATADQITSAIAGNATTKTGIHALRNALSLTGMEPGLLLAPGYTSLTPGGVKNAVVAAMEAVCGFITDAMAVVDAPSANLAGAITHAGYSATSLCTICCGVAAKVDLGAGAVVKPLSPHVAAAIVRRDKEAGTPFKAAWNKPLKGILGTSRPIEYRDGDASCEANQMCQAGLVTVIETNLLWGPFTTATDPTTKAWRSIKRIRTRRAIERALLRPLRAYLAADLTPHLVTLLYSAIDDYLDGLHAISALIDHELVWDTSLNPSTLLRDGGLRVKARWEETPELTDLGIYTEPMPEAFDILASAISAALASLGDDNIRVAA